MLNACEWTKKCFSYIEINIYQNQKKKFRKLKVYYMMRWENVDRQEQQFWKKNTLIRQINRKHRAISV